MDRESNSIAAVILVAALLLAALFALAVPGAPPEETDCPDNQCVTPIPRFNADLLRAPTGADVPSGYEEAPAMDLPEPLRTHNWGGGSCVHASTVSLLRWQGQDDLADWWRDSYSGGEYAERLLKRMDAAGLRFAYTLNGDPAFLEWCTRTRRGAGIFYKPSHAINCIHLDDKEAWLLDNNRTDVYETVSRNEFLTRWKRDYGGFAWTIVYTPPPPLPYYSGK